MIQKSNKCKIGVSDYVAVFVLCLLFRKKMSILGERGCEMSRIAYLIAGANGSGKTTLAKGLLSDEKLTFLNADEIALELCPENLESVRISAGKKLFKQLENCIKQEMSFALETTLSGNLYVKVIEKLKRKGYKTSLVYVFLDTPDMCIERIKTRVKEGGHYIPDEDVKRRYHRSLKNFWNVYKGLVNNWALYYNGPEKNVLVASGESDKIDIQDEMLYNKFKEGLKK